ncbi:MAG: NUDIX hydrolase N-terminal domain-containing protein [Lachnospiraceae bacterium]|nr:NUDIX hydrolase N-terminal domain-containing protein [Lachnospiraceae bacterium]
MVITVRFHTPDFDEKLLQWAVELQSLAQAGIFYGDDIKYFENQ